MLGVVVVAWWYFKNNGMPFIPTQASGEFKGNPTSLNYGGQGDVYSGNPVQTISGTWHL